MIAFFTWLAAHGENLTIDNLHWCQIMVIEWCFMSKGPVKQWITSSFTVSMRGNCGLWFSVCMEFIGLCPARYLIFWLVGGGKVTQKVTLLFGMPFLRV
jgi:hypothetical protein